MKRKHEDGVEDRQGKRCKSESDQSASATPFSVDHPVLRRLYPQVLTLRHYLLSRLPSSSKNRRRRILQLGLSQSGIAAAATRDSDTALACLLDKTLVGVTAKALEANGREDCQRLKDIESFSQQVLDSTIGSTLNPESLQQTEIVDLVIWILFRRHQSSYRPPHLLCHGFQRASPTGQNGLMLSAAQAIPGILSHSPNTNVDTVKGPLWIRIYSFLGRSADRMMLDLLLDCGIFRSVEGSYGNYCQLSGFPISEMKPLTIQKLPPTVADCKKIKKSMSHIPTLRKEEPRNPSSIRFVRSRMLYARAALNAKGGIRFGMRHIHVLNRFPNHKDHGQTVHIMKYIFPLQFGLHNVFTSKVDGRDTALPFKDYTLREKEIQQLKMRQAAKRDISDKVQEHLPKRLRGNTVKLVDKLRKLNKKCAYTELLRHYCPVEGLDLSPKPDWRKNPLQPSSGNAPAIHTSQGVEQDNANQKTVEETCFTDMASPVAHVSAFCRAVVANVVPNDFWGDGDNKRNIMYWIDQFVCIRRFETLTLHQVTQKFKVSSLTWLQPADQTPTSKMAKSDFEKRKEVLQEFIYWIFDSFVVPMIRSNFHVTESNVHKNRLFYFRHDVWRMLTEPSFSHLKTNMFEEMAGEEALSVLSSRPIGFSKVRLLPKKTGTRMITNLRRRQQTTKNGLTILGRSINAVMTPVFNVINYEKSLQPDRFGSSLFSISDMYPKLAAFRSSLRDRGLSDAPLYFAKVDVQSCFDTIPQQRLIPMVESLLALEEYQIGRHAEISALGRLQCLDGPQGNREPVRRFIPHSKAAGEVSSFETLVRQKFAGTKSNTIFVDMAVQQYETKDDLMQLLKEHVQRNLVQIGKKLYRQKTGIPQGSVLSSVLCNFFYAELERDVLRCVLDHDALLLRLLDDFLLITVKREHAERFLQIMHRGQPEYGVSVKAAKSLANFEMVLEHGYKIGKPPSDNAFPYCGVLINTSTLEICKKSDPLNRGNIADSLTVDMARVPGQTFHRKALNAFKIQLHAMFVDTGFNSVPTVLANLYRSFLESAVRCFEYIRKLSLARRVGTRLLIKTVEKIIGLAFVMLQRRSRSREKQNEEGVRSAIGRHQIQWLALMAFREVFQPRQTQYLGLLGWLDSSLAAVSPQLWRRKAACWKAAGLGVHSRGGARCKPERGWMRNDAGWLRS